MFFIAVHPKKTGEGGIVDKDKQDINVATEKIHVAVLELLKMAKKLNDPRLRQQAKIVQYLSEANTPVWNEIQQQVLKLCTQVGFSIEDADEDFSQKELLMNMSKFSFLYDVPFSKQKELIQMSHDVYRVKATILSTLKQVLEMELSTTQH